MINVTALIQLKAFARQDGFFLFLLWLASFAAVVTNPTSSWGTLLAMATPFFVGWLLVRFRNYALSGVISFRRALAFSLYTFFYASMLFAVAQFVYFRFLDNGALFTMLLNSVKALEPFYKANGMSVAEMRQQITMIGQLSPIEIAFIFMMQNFFVGIILSFPIALFGKRTVAPTQQGNSESKNIGN